MEIGYQYFFDRDAYENDRLWILRRNPVDQNEQLMYSTYDKTDFKRIPIIAQGFLVFLKQDVYLDGDRPIIPLIKKYGKIGTYHRYFDDQINFLVRKFLDSPEDIDEEEANQIAIRKHFENETKYLQDSIEYFKEGDNERDREKKDLLKKYADGYLKWVEKKITKRKPNLKMKNSFSENELKEIIKRLIEMKVIQEEDGELFRFINLGISVNQKVRWNGDVKDAKMGLFALTYFLTGRKVHASELKKYYTPISKDKSFKIYDGLYGNAYKDGNEGLLNTRFIENLVDKK